MQWLNYHHLLYFWLVAREGSVTRASEELHLAPSTVSGQIRALEESVGERLFVRQGRGLALTDTGRLVYQYADDIFRIGRELQSALGGRDTGRPMTLVVGVAPAVPKLVVHQLLQPALMSGGELHLVCREDSPEQLFASLAVHELDVVISDAPMPPSVRVKAYSHLLGDCDVLFFAPKEQAARYKRRFPRSLDGAPLLLPTEKSSLRLALERWFEAQGVRPRIVGEFDDSALMKVLGQFGMGVFPVPSVIADEVARQYRVRPIGRAPEVRDRFFAISAERRLKHPAVVAISEAARKELFR